MFINSIDAIRLNSQCPFSIYLAEYHIKSFKPELFASESIKPPANFYKCVEKRLAEYLAGRCCAQKALQSLGILGFDILSAEDRSPVWPTKIAGSITHSSRFAAAACTLDFNVGVGIDIEKVFHAKQLRLEEHICSSNEISYLQSLQSKLDINTLFTLVFSAKESLYKALYPTINLFFSFDFIEVISIDLDHSIVTFHVAKNIGNKIISGTQFNCYYQMINNTHCLTYCAIELSAIK